MTLFDDSSVVRVKETKIRTSNATPNKHPRILGTSGLPIPLTIEEQEILRRALMRSVTILDEGHFVGDVDQINESGDTTPIIITKSR